MPVSIVSEVPEERGQGTGNFGNKGQVVSPEGAGGSGECLEMLVGSGSRFGHNTVHGMLAGFAQNGFVHSPAGLGV